MRAGKLVFPVGDVGSELTSNSSKNLRNSKSSAAESGAVTIDLSKIDPDLLAVIEAWPGLAASSRSAIIDLLRLEIKGDVE
jgi:hypothetical protein